MSTTALYTADDLLRMPERDGVRYELVDGALKVMAPAGGAHGAIVMELATALNQHVRAHRLGRLFSESTGFLLRRNPDTVCAPDIAFVTASRLPAALPIGFLQLAPDVAVEVISPSDTVAEVGRKVEEYMQAGVRSIWIVDPSNRTVTVHSPAQGVRILREPDVLDGGDVLPGFRRPVSELFAAIRTP
jgi:Uma2 family endonuclease